MEKLKTYTDNVLYYVERLNKNTEHTPQGATLNTAGVYSLEALSGWVDSLRHDVARVEQRVVDLENANDELTDRNKTLTDDNEKLEATCKRLEFFKESDEKQIITLYNLFTWLYYNDVLDCRKLSTMKDRESKRILSIINNCK